MNKEKVLLATSFEMIIGQLLTMNKHVGHLPEEELGAFLHTLTATITALETVCEQEFLELFPEREKAYFGLKATIGTYDSGE